MSDYIASPHIGLPDPEKKVVAIMEPGSIASEANLADRRGSPWYKKLSLSIRRNGKSGRSSVARDSMEATFMSLEDYLNKPLPLPPSPRLLPYFEYMFADAGMRKEQSEETIDLSNELESSTDGIKVIESVHNSTATSSNSSAQSYGLESSEIAEFAFAHNGVNVSTKETIDNHFAALGTSLEGQLDLELLAEDLEREQATEDFFCGVEVREAPSPDHVPIVDEDGFVDRREGLEEWPELWRHEEETDIRAHNDSESCTVPEHTKAPEYYNNASQKNILQPKTRKNKAYFQDIFLPHSYTAATSTFPAQAAPSVQSPVRAPRPLTIRKRNKPHGCSYDKAAGKPHRVNKRSARDSFVTKSNVNNSISDDYNINLLSTKKIRVTESLVSEKDGSSPSRAISICGSISTPSTVDLTLVSSPLVSPSTECTDPDVQFIDAPVVVIDSDDDDDTSSLLSLKRRRLTGNQSGYPGQFESYEADYLHVKASLPVPATFRITGELGHANGFFTHKNFHKDPTFPAFDYTKAMLDRLPVRDMALKHAENMVRDYSCSDEISACRTETQEMLRKELHRECALARLEGVSVGEYRYYQGFLSLEEYLGARMCVCWGYCWCSKLCSIYGDVLCPCSEWIEYHGDD